MKILCLDDEELALKMLQMAVEKAKPDAEVLGFDDQDDLLDEAEKGGCDVAFLDIHMRGMNGVTVAKKLKEINRKMNIIFVTGFSEYKGQAMDMKASGYIMKPVTVKEVKAELDDLRFPIVPKQNAKLRVQCFGNFDVFTPDGAHVRFERSKSKEVFAYLVHKQGSSCTTREIFATIFEGHAEKPEGCRRRGCGSPQLQRPCCQSRGAGLRLLPVQGAGRRRGQCLSERIYEPVFLG